MSVAGSARGGWALARWRRCGLVARPSEVHSLVHCRTRPTLPLHPTPHTPHPTPRSTFALNRERACDFLNQLERLYGGWLGAVGGWWGGVQGCWEPRV